MFWTISKHEYYDTCIIIQKKMFFPKFYLSSGKNSLKGCWPPGCEYCCPGVLFFCPCAILKYKVTIIPIKHIVKFDFTLIPFIIYWDTHYITVRNQKLETHVYILSIMHMNQLIKYCSLLKSPGKCHSIWKRPIMWERASSLCFCLQ